MGVFSKHHRFREAGEDVNVNNLEEFGVPARSLFTTSKVFTLHHRITVTDENENPVYYVESKAISIHDKTDITMADGKQVAHIEKKIISLHERHFITMENGLEFELSNEIFHIIKDITNIEGLGWQLRGNIMGMNFQLYDEKEQIVAVISQKLISLHDKYCIDIYQPENEEIAVAILITLQHMIRDREASASASSSSSSSSAQ